MLIIDSHQYIQSFLSGIGVSPLGLQVDRATFDLMEAPTGEFYLIHADVLSSFDAEELKKLDNAWGVIIFSESDLLEQQKLHHKVVDHINMKKSASGLLQQKLQFFYQAEKNNLRMKSQFVSLNLELESVMGNLSSELQKVKKIYALNVPKRVEDLKVAKLYSKYLVGTESGSDFFDIIRLPDEVLLFMSSTSSYLISSSLLTQFMSLKGQKNITDDQLAHFVKVMKNGVRELNEGRENKVRADICFVRIKYRSLKTTIYSEGQFLFYVTSEDGIFYPHEKNDIGLYSYTLNLQRGERFFIGSPGLESLLKKNSLGQVVESILNQEDFEIGGLDEIFVKLSEKLNSNMPQHDLSAVVLEVDENAFLEI